MAGSKQVPRAPAKGNKRTAPNASPKVSERHADPANTSLTFSQQKSSKTTAQINRDARKRQKRKERVTLLKEEHRRCTEERYARGEKPWKPCHVCRKEGHWDRDCPKYGAWKAMMDAKKA